MRRYINILAIMLLLFVGGCNSDREYITIDSEDSIRIERIGDELRVYPDN